MQLVQIFDRRIFHDFVDQLASGNIQNNFIDIDINQYSFVWKKKTI